MAERQSLFSRLLIWTALGLWFAGATFYCGLTGDWIGFIASLATTLFVQVMLMTGLWMRWPRG